MSDILDRTQKLAADVRLALDRALAQPNAHKEVAQLSIVLVRCLRDIGRMTGQFDLTEPMILQSQAWQRIKGIVALWAPKHPKAAQDLASLLQESDRTNPEPKKPRRRKAAK